MALFQSKINTKLYIRRLIKIKYEAEKDTKLQKIRKYIRNICLKNITKNFGPKHFKKFFG